MNGDDENVVTFPVRARPRSDAPLVLVSPYASKACEHASIVVDECKAEVECGTCGAKLNPIWVLARMATEDRRLMERWARAKASLQLLAERTRCKCDHCGKITRVRQKATEYAIAERAEQIRREEAERDGLR